MNNPVFEVTLGAPSTTDDVFELLDFEYQAGAWREKSLITQKNFPLVPHPPEVIGIKFVDSPDSKFSIKEGLRALSIAETGRPTYEHALRFIEQHGHITTPPKEFGFILFLHEPWQDSNGKYWVLALLRVPHKAITFLVSSDEDFCAGDIPFLLAGTVPIA
jgi:hypothetical protein